MDLVQLRCFVAVAEELHFARAAVRLHMTPSPVSRMIKNLERELGGDLFVRQHHNVELTVLGRGVLGKAREIVREADGLRTLAAGIVAEHRVLRVGTSYLVRPGLAEHFVALAEDLVAPGTVDLTFAVSSTLIPDLVAGGLDIALVHLPVTDDELDSIVLGRYRFMLAMRSDDEFAVRDHLTLGELTARTLTIHTTSPHPLVVGGFHQRLAEAGITRFHTMPSMDPVQLAAHIRRSNGLTLTTDPTQGGFPSVFRHEDFAVVPLSGPVPPLDVGVAWNRERHAVDPVLQNLVEALRSASAAE